MCVKILRPMKGFTTRIAKNKKESTKAYAGNQCANKLVKQDQPGRVTLDIELRLDIATSQKRVVELHKF